MTKTASRACPVCGHAEVEWLHTQGFELPEGHALPSQYDVVVCLQCGFVYADTTATQNDYDRYYAKLSKYEDKTTGTGGGDSPWDAERLAATAMDLARFGIARSARILDLGCANGGLLRALGSLGYTNLYGVDPSLVCVRNTRAAGMPARQGSFLDLPAGLGQFECIVLSHVLEHIADLHRAMAALIPHLAPEGRLYIEVPDPTRYADFLYAPFQDFNTEHINHFSHLSLSNLAGWYSLQPVAEERKTLSAAEDCFYPAMFSLFEFGVAGKLTRDTRTKDEMLRYIRESCAQLERMDARIREALKNSPQLMIWGTGQLAMKLFRDTALRDARVIVCIDGNPLNAGKKLMGAPIVEPRHIPSRTVPILITSTLHETAIRRKIAALGLPNPLISLRD